MSEDPAIPENRIASSRPAASLHHIIVSVYSEMCTSGEGYLVTQEHELFFLVFAGLWVS